MTHADSDPPRRARPVRLRIVGPDPRRNPAAAARRPRLPVRPGRHDRGVPPDTVQPPRLSTRVRAGGRPNPRAAGRATNWPTPESPTRSTTYSAWCSPSTRRAALPPTATTAADGRSGDRGGRHARRIRCSSPRPSPTTSSRRWSPSRRVPGRRRRTVGFGLDAVIEVSSAAVSRGSSPPGPRDPRANRLRLIAFSFFALAAYVAVDAVLTLRGWRGHAIADRHRAGRPSLLVMPALSLAQRRAGHEIGSLSAVADSKQTLLCSYLSAVLLAGLLLNSCSAGRGLTR